MAFIEGPSEEERRKNAQRQMEILKNSKPDPRYEEMNNPTCPHCGKRRDGERKALLDGLEFEIKIKKPKGQDEKD